MRIFLLGMLLSLVLTAPETSAAPRPSRSAALAILQASSAASGEMQLSSHAAMILTGRADRFGLRGTYRNIVDVRTGEFRWQGDYRVTSEEEGFSRHRRWRADASHQVHSLDSLEARTTAVTEAYLARRGYLRSETAHIVLSGSARDRYGRQSWLIAVTPPHGRTALLWIGQKDHFVHRIDFQRSERVDTARFDDYRRIKGIALPFSIVNDDGDGSLCIHVTSYRFLDRVGASAFRPPTRHSEDTSICPQTAHHVPLLCDRMTGFPMIYVKINGKDPLPFIVDTGGHDIVTPAAAQRLRLKVMGRGVSFGAGAGSVPTAFTRIRSVKIGCAEMRDQPFVVLGQDLGSLIDPKGREMPISGILGLELFERFAVTLDFPRHAFVLRQMHRPYRGNGTVMPIQFTSDEPLISMQVNGRTGSFAVDTGNNVGLIVYHQWIATAPMSGLHLRGDTMAGSAVGGAVFFQHARARSVRIGDIKMRDVPTLISDAHSGSMSSRSEAGSLGTPVLARFCVTFDYAAGKIILQP